MNQKKLENLTAGIIIALIFIAMVVVLVRAIKWLIIGDF